MTTVQGRWLLGGGIGSGKSSVRRLLNEHGIPTIDADSIGHTVLEPGGPAFDEATARWPQVVEGGVINRRRLGELVFADPVQLKALESITHPHIFDTIREQVEGIGLGVVVEMPLIGRRLGDEWRQIVVDCKDELRLKRAVERGLGEPTVRARMAAQPSRAEWLAEADLVIPNHGSMDELEVSVASVVSRL